MDEYILLLKNGDFVSFEQISENEVEITPATYYQATPLLTLEHAKELAKGINKRKDGKFTIYSPHDVVRIMKIYSVE